MAKVFNRRKARFLRHKRVRKRVFAVSDVPRLAVYKSNRHVYAQIIDDTEGRTLVSASTLSPELKGKEESPIQLSALVGKLVAEKALKKDIRKVVFDRGGHMYHGVVKALADSAREAGLKF